MRGYEAIFILRPSLNEEERMKHVEKIEKIIATNGALHETNYWGRKRFAYPIQKFTDGHFFMFVFDAESSIPYELKRLTKVTETILRSLIIVRKTCYPVKDIPVQPAAPIVSETAESVEAESAETVMEEIKIEETNAE
jgi:small subunit ribosomal protein S6